VTARSRERGSHAGRPRGHGLPFTVPGLPLGTVRSGGRAAPASPVPGPAVSGPAGPGAPVPPVSPSAPADLPGPPRPPQAAPHGSRHRKPPERRSPLRKLRLPLAVVVVLAVVGVGFTTGFGDPASAEPTVQAFLLAWQQGHYDTAAALTDGDASEVRTELASSYTDLDASNTFYALDSTTQHGDTAVATFTATVDLAEGGQQWMYVGRFGLKAVGGKWVIAWSPSVVNPGLGAGERLAVETTYAPRASLTDYRGTPLVSESMDYRIGVYPDQLKNPAATAAAFSQVTELDEQQVLGQIQGAPPKEFLSLLTLDPSDYASLWPKLDKVPGLTVQRRQDRLFSSSAQDVTGVVGTEDSDELRNEGAAYQPGMTVGLTGLEQTYQDQLLGTPTTSVVVVNAAGNAVDTLWSSTDGRAGTPVRTTLERQLQSAAVNALAGASNSAEIVAVDTQTGQIRAIASREAHGVKLPAGGVLDAKVEPGMTFSIVSAAALLSTGVTAGHALPCESEADVGGVTFTDQPGSSATATLASDFADGCGTAFANMSRTLTAQQLTTVEKGFGIGSPWRLPLSTFSGSTAAVSGEADVASQVTGSGGVLMSPLGLATVAAEVASGTGHTPTLIPTDASSSRTVPLTSTQLSELRQLMRLAVTSGSARAANLSGTPVYGQAGVVQTGTNAYLSWFVGYRGTTAVAVLEASTSASSAAAVAGTFLQSVTS
jgi:cell division protein FtsI/penicillin-binding protein 2